MYLFEAQLFCVKGVGLNDVHVLRSLTALATTEFCFLEGGRAKHGFWKVWGCCNSSRRRNPTTLDSPKPTPQNLMSIKHPAVANPELSTPKPSQRYKCQCNDLQSWENAVLDLPHPYIHLSIYLSIYLSLSEHMSQNLIESFGQGAYADQ